jgi:hypothetical protein
MSDSELDKLKTKVQQMIMGIFGAAFLLGFAYQLIVPIVCIAGAVIAIRLLYALVSKHFRDW